MDYLPVISRLFRDKVIVKPKKSAIGTYNIVLKEKDSSAKLKEVKIENIPPSSRAIKLDDSKPKNSLLKGEKGELNRCDYVLFVDYENKLYRYYIELKSKSPKGHKKQLKASACLMKYCDILAQVFHNDNSLGYKREERFILFKRGVVKRPTKIEPCRWGQNSSDNCYEIVLSSKIASISFSRLLR